MVALSRSISDFLRCFNSGQACFQIASLTTMFFQRKNMALAVTISRLALMKQTRAYRLAIGKKHGKQQSCALELYAEGMTLDTQLALECLRLAYRFQWSQSSWVGVPARQFA